MCKVSFECHVMTSYERSHSHYAIKFLCYRHLIPKGILEICKPLCLGWKFLRKAVDLKPPSFVKQWIMESWTSKSHFSTAPFLSPATTFTSIGCNHHETYQKGCVILSSGLCPQKKRNCNQLAQAVLFAAMCLVEKFNDFPFHGYHCLFPRHCVRFGCWQQVYYRVPSHLVKPKRAAKTSETASKQMFRLSRLANRCAKTRLSISMHPFVYQSACLPLSALVLTVPSHIQVPGLEMRNYVEVAGTLLNSKERYLFFPLSKALIRSCFTKRHTMLSTETGLDNLVAIVEPYLQKHHSTMVCQPQEPKAKDTSQILMFKQWTNAQLIKTCHSFEWGPLFIM